MDDMGDDHKDFHTVDSRVLQSTGKTVSHTRDCEQASGVHVPLENVLEAHPSFAESESKDESINISETFNSAIDCSKIAFDEITVNTICTYTDSGSEHINIVNNIEMKTVEVLDGPGPRDHDNDVSDGRMREEENITKSEIENCVSCVYETIYKRTYLEDDIKEDDYCRDKNNEEVNDGCDEVDGLGKLVKQTVKTFITCGSGKGMTIGEDKRPFEKANEETGDYEWVNSDLYKQEIEIKSGKIVVREKEEMVSKVIVSLEKPATASSSEHTPDYTEATTEQCQFYLPSHDEESEVKPSKTSQITNTTFSGKEVLLVDPYNFSHSKRGYMVIIVNDTFKRQSYRDGAFRDLNYLKNIAYKLGLTVYKCENTNLSLKKTLQLLHDVRSLDHSDCDMLAVAISTHGMEQPNPKAKGKSDHTLVCADDRLIFTSTITEMFNDENCPSLRNKPKMFIIQACRGEEHDNGADLDVLTKKTGTDQTCDCNTESRRQPCLDDSDVRGAEDSWAGGPDNHSQPGHLHDDHAAPTGSDSSALPMIPPFTSAQLVREPLRSSPRPKPFPIVDTPSLKCENDQLVFYAIPPGMFAWRNTEDGSWMLYYLNNLIKNCDGRRPINILKMLLKVNAQMALRTTNVPSDKKLDKKKAISVVEHKLTRDLIFPPLVRA